MSNHGGVRKGAGRPKSEPTKLMRAPVAAEPLVKHLIDVYKNYTQDDINDILDRAARFPELESFAVLLQLADHSFIHTRRLLTHYRSRDGYVLELLPSGELHKRE